MPRPLIQRIKQAGTKESDVEPANCVRLHCYGTAVVSIVIQFIDGSASRSSVGDSANTRVENCLISSSVRAYEQASISPNTIIYNSLQT